MRQFQEGSQGGREVPAWSRVSCPCPWWPGRLEPGRAMVFCCGDSCVTSDQLSGSWDRKGKTRKDLATGSRHISDWV